MMVTFNLTEVSNGYDQPEVYRANRKPGGLSICGQLPPLRKVPQFTGGQHSLERSKYSNKAVNHSNKTATHCTKNW